MSAQHTPGPWRLHPTDDTMVIAGGAVVAGAFGNYNDPKIWPTMEANARLIAAAPDMLAALREIAADIDNDAVPGWQIYQKAIAAIAKAEATQ